MADPPARVYSPLVIRRFPLSLLWMAWMIVPAAVSQVVAFENVWLKANIADSSIHLQVYGPEYLDWFLQESSDLAKWSPVNTPPLWSKAKRPPVRSLSLQESNHFFRITPTTGLFDTNVLRRIDLTFAETNWAAILSNYYKASGYVSLGPASSNLSGRLVVDNGVEVPSVGVHFRGWSSYDANKFKKSLNVEVSAYDSAARLMGYKTINLNNFAGDAVLFREPLYFNIFSQYAPSPRGALAWVTINGAPQGLYALVEQVNSQFLQRYFQSDKGDRWKTTNLPNGNSGFTYFGTNSAAYTKFYELKNGHPEKAWPRLVSAITALTNTVWSFDSLDQFLAADSWTWFFAVENIFEDHDSYYAKGADFNFYYELETGRFHPIQHDGNETFTGFAQNLLDHRNRPLLIAVLNNPELRERYLAHARTVIEESLKPEKLLPALTFYTNLNWSAVLADTNRGFPLSMVQDGRYVNDIRRFVENRYAFLMRMPELQALPPVISSVQVVPSTPPESVAARIEANVTPGDTNGTSSVWLYWRDNHFGRFLRREMRDNGANGDAVAGDGIYAAVTTNYPPNTVVQFYIEARSGNTNRTATFSPARAERLTYSYRVALPWEE